jgi:hypothetical protein
MNEHTQAAWHPATRRYYDVIARGGQARDTVNAAIRLRDDQGGQGTGGAMGMVEMTCSAGISPGEIIGFTTPMGRQTSSARGGQYPQLKVTWV